MPSNHGRRRLLQRVGLAVAATLVVPTTLFATAAPAAAATAFPACSPSQGAPCTFGNFEVDGDTAVDGGAVDWASPPQNLTTFTDACSKLCGRSTADDSFLGGAKEPDQTTWTCGTSGAPSKADLMLGQIAFKVINNVQYLYVDFRRQGTTGDAHLDYEFNKAGTPVAGSCGSFGIPKRADGDKLITFDTENGGKVFVFRAYTWNDTTKSFGNALSAVQGTVFAAAVNGITCTTSVCSDKSTTTGSFGEASVNLNALFSTAGPPFACGQFGLAWLKDRVSTAGENQAEDIGSSALADFTSPKPFNPGDCPKSSLAKAVRNVTANQQFTSAGPTSTTASPGDTVQYRLTYTNDGDASATGVVIKDTVPARSTATACSSSCTPTPPQPAGTTLTWNVGTVAAHTSVAVTFDTRLDASFPAGTTTIDNVATTTTDQEKTPIPSNHTTVTVTGQPNLALVKSAVTTAPTGVTPGPGDKITYTLRYSNSSAYDASGVVIKDPVPTGTTYSSCTGGCTTTGSPVSSVTWSIGTVLAGGSGSVSFTVTIAYSVGCKVCNTATIASPDENQGAPISSNTLCVTTAPAGDPTLANASGSTLGAHVSDSGSAVNVDLPDAAHGGSATSAQHGAGTNGPNSTEQVNITLPPGSSTPVLQADLIATSSKSVIDGSGADAASTAETLGVCLVKDTLGTCLVSADTVIGMAHATATGSAATEDITGSSFQNLVINVSGSPCTKSAPCADVPPNTTVNLPALGFGKGSYVKLKAPAFNVGKPTTSTGGTYSSTVTTTMIDVHITKLAVTGNAIDIQVSRATASADFPQATRCGASQSVSGEAFVASLVTTSQTLDPLNLTVGLVDIPGTGGSASQSLLSAALPSDGSGVTVGLASTSTTGTLGATSSTSSSYADVANVCVMRSAAGCLISADAVRSQSSSSASASGASSNDAGTNFVNLRVPGLGTINGSVPANTVVPLPLSGVTVILNHQFCDNGVDITTTPTCGAAGHTGLTVQAIDVVVTLPDNPLVTGSEIVVSSAHSDATYL
jgi:uncharacterized repeat protein (TIGR01451 family)